MVAQDYLCQEKLFCPILSLKAIVDTITCVDCEVDGFAPHTFFDAKPHIKSFLSFADDFRVSFTSPVPEKLDSWLPAKFTAKSLDFVLVLQPGSHILHYLDCFKTTAAVALVENGLHFLPRR